MSQRLLKPLRVVLALALLAAINGSTLALHVLLVLAAWAGGRD